MKHIRQQHKDSCGVAAFGMVMNLSYRKAMRIIFPKRFWWFSSATTTISMLRLAYKKLGYETEVIGSGESTITFDFTNIRTKTLLVVNPVVPQKDPEVKHAVVWCPLTKSIFDPATDTGLVSNYSVEYCLANLWAAIVIT